MNTLVRIPYVDIRTGTPVDLLRHYPENARALARAAAGTFGAVSRIGSRLAFPIGDRLSRAWLACSNNPYRAEITELASVLGIRGVTMLNVCFEWGCTSGVWQTRDGPLMRRVLDWPFPHLGEHLVVAHQSGPAGDFLNMTWPGISGVFHAMAPGRFAAAINQAPMRRHRSGYVGDWARNRLAVRRETGLPPAHLLRKTFETASNYAVAKEIFCSAPIAVPAIFILAGVASDEGCVVERTENDAAVHELREGRVCTANHFVSRLNTIGSWTARPIDSEGRLRCALALADTADSFAWFVPPIANVNSRLAFEANAANAKLALIGTAGARPVTERFQLA